jgi:hypothetical protein
MEQNSNQQPHHYRYVQNNMGAFLAELAMFVFIITAIISIIQGCREIALINDYINNVRFDLHSFQQIFADRHLLSSITIVVYIACRSLFVNWAFYAHKNLRFFYGKQGIFDVWRMIFGFIIPLANFVLPIVLVNQIWHASNPAIKTIDEVKQQKSAKFITAWWCLNLFWIFFSIWNQAMKVAVSSRVRNLSFDSVLFQYKMTIVCDVVGIMVMLWTIYIIYAINRREEIKYKEWQHP